MRFLNICSGRCLLGVRGSRDTTNHSVFRLISQLHGRSGDSMATMTGTIKRLVSDKGFGFILAGDGNEYFFHNSACAQTRFDDLREGQTVTFDRVQGPKGPRGENVKVAS